jgi:hypothetical protein
LNTIGRIQIYINKNRKSLSQIKKETGASFIINGGLYESNWTPCCHLKADGVVYHKDQYTYWGFGWNSGSDIQMVSDYSNLQNYICCTALIDPNGITKPIYTSAQSGTRGRTAIGLKGDNLALYVSSDGSKDANTPEGLQDELNDYGWTRAIMLDSGGSSQCDMNGKIISSSREVQNLILVYVNQDQGTATKEEIKTDSGVNIIKNYLTNNRCYKNNTKKNKTKAMLHSTGTPAAMAKSIMNNWNNSSANACVEFIIDDTGIYQTLPLGIKSWHAGEPANSKYIACEVCEPVYTRLLPINWYPLSKGDKYNSNYAVTQLQKELVALGYDPKGIDGSFGNGCETALKEFQKDKGLVVDGCCGSKTLAEFQKRNGSHLCYQLNDAKEYFDNVYQKAVTLFAWIMKEVGGNPDEILCHSEGYKKGIATNHADVMHWFPAHGKNMDIFREDVKKSMNFDLGDKKTDNLNTNSDVADWAKDAWNKAKNKVLLDGTRPTDPITRQEFAVVLDRLKLLD